MAAMPFGTRMLDLEVRRDELDRVRVVETRLPRLRDGQVLMRVERFGCSANNISYALLGDTLRYWDFFPATDGWGRIPVWGFAHVMDSATDALAEGVRVFGYCPMATHVIVTPGRVGSKGFADVAPHRAQLPPAYNAYRRVDTDPGYDPDREDQQTMLRPLFFLSFLLDDYLAENELFGADTALMSSASSKAALGAAFLLARRGARVVGLTSDTKVSFLADLGVYDSVIGYGSVETLDRRTVTFIDLAGNAKLQHAVLRHFGDQLRQTVVAGATHQQGWAATQLTPSDEPAANPRSVSFSAPDRIVARTREWGHSGLDARMADAWGPFAEWCDAWLVIKRKHGPPAVEAAYREILHDKVPPANAYVLSMWSE
jgi:hypothetical protein